MKERKQIVCTVDLYMMPAAVKGKTYSIIHETKEEITIRNEQDEIHNFSKSPESESYVGIWFDWDTGNTKAQ